MVIGKPAITAIPVLETERLILRGHDIQDLDSSFALWSNPTTVAHITGNPSTRQESWSRILRYAGLWHLLGFGYWAIVEKASGRFVGDVGFGDFKRGITPSLDGIPETGWVLDPAFHGKGYATEAVRSALSWIEHHLSAPVTACIVSPENLASLRVAEKCGYLEVARTIYNGHDTIMLQRDCLS